MSDSVTITRSDLKRFVATAKELRQMKETESLKAFEDLFKRFLISEAERIPFSEWPKPILSAYLDAHARFPIGGLAFKRANKAAHRPKSERRGK